MTIVSGTSAVTYGTVLRRKAGFTSDNLTAGMGKRSPSIGPYIPADEGSNCASGCGSSGSGDGGGPCTEVTGMLVAQAAKPKAAPTAQSPVRMWRRFSAGIAVSFTIIRAAPRIQCRPRVPSANDCDEAVRRTWLAYPGLSPSSARPGLPGQPGNYRWLGLPARVRLGRPSIGRHGLDDLPVGKLSRMRGPGAARRGIDRRRRPRLDLHVTPVRIVGHRARGRVDMFITAIGVGLRDVYRRRAVAARDIGRRRVYRRRIDRRWLAIALVFVGPLVDHVGAVRGRGERKRQGRPREPCGGKTGVERRKHTHDSLRSPKAFVRGRNAIATFEMRRRP